MLKHTVLHLTWASGALAPFRLANRGKLLILTYHRFSDRDDLVSTSERAFRQQLEYLTAHYRIVSLSQIVRWRTEGVRVPAGCAAITIDDGYRDAYEIAFPILARFNAPATIFAVTDFVDRKAWLWTDKMRFLMSRARAAEFETVIAGRGLRLELGGDAATRRKTASRVNAVLKTLPDEAKEESIDRIAASLRVELPDLPPPEFSAATWSELREMESAGLEIGSHTLTHPMLTKVNDNRLYRELNESGSRLEFMLGHRVEQFCYPNGAHDARVEQAVAAAGYRCVVTTDRGMNSRWCDLMALRRIDSELDLPHFVQSTSGAEDMKSKLRALFGEGRPTP